MQIVGDNAVQLTDAEMVVRAWYDSYLDQGLGMQAAYESLTSVIPDEGKVYELVKSMEVFLVEGVREYLLSLREV